MTTPEDYGLDAEQLREKYLPHEFGIEKAWIWLFRIILRGKPTPGCIR